MYSEFKRNICLSPLFASDDAAVMATCDRASYAEIPLDFMQRGMRAPNLHGVAMARYGRPHELIHRILDGTSLSHGITRWSMAAILTLASPLADIVAVAQPQPSRTEVARRPETLAWLPHQPRRRQARSSTSNRQGLLIPGTI
jgi:hypothetical protein